MTSPEIRYRRLLALYPRDFRREYEEELIGVLMTDERRGPGQVLDLVRAAVTVRLRQAVDATDLRRAAWVVQLFGAILLLALAGRRVIWVLTTPWLHPEATPVYPAAVDWVRFGAWALVAVAALLGWRILALAGAATGLAGEIASPFRYYLDTPATVLNAYWIIVAAAAVLIAGMVAHRGDARHRGEIAVVAAGLLLVLHGVTPWYLGSYRIYYVLPLVAAGLVLLGMLRQEPDMRWWVAVWAAPVLAAVLVVRVGFAGFVEHNMGHPEALRLIDGGQWTVLVLVPVLAFLAAALAATRFRGRRTGTK